MKRLFLIDGTALAYRAHFAFAMSSRGGLSTSEGRPVSAIYGFTTTLISLLEREQPDAVVVSFDGATEDLERTKVYPDYKSTRDKMPDELVDQLATIEEMVAAWGIPVVRSPGHEADDVIGTLAVRARDAGMTVFLVTSDKDFMQIVGPRIKLWNLRASTRAPEILGAAEVRAKFGVPPDKMVDLLALMGDSSDHIPGVPKVGQKTAAQLLQEFGDLDAVLEHAGDVKRPSVREALQTHTEQARLSRQLVTLHTDVPLDLDVEKLAPPRPDRERLEELLRELEFESLLKNLPSEQAPEIEQHYECVRSEAELQALLGEIERAGSVSVAPETKGSGVLDVKLVGLAFSWRPGRAHYLPLDRHPPLLEGVRAAVLERLRPLLCSPDTRVTSHDAKALKAVLRNEGVELAGVDFDTSLASYCLSPNQSGHDLDTIALRYLSLKKTPRKAAGGKKQQRTFDMVDADEVTKLCGEDADVTWRLRGQLETMVGEAGVGDVLRDIELPLVDVLLAMEREGIAVDLDQLKRLSDDLAARIGKLEEQVHAEAGEPFNLNSPAQVGEVFFGTLELHKAAGIKPKRTRTGQFKTDAATLEKLAEHHPMVRLLLDYRQLSKLKGTYVDALQALVHPRTGRLHTTFNQTVAATGRLSSDNPNLQNIPIRTAEGRNVRKAFVARGEGWQLLSADYSQIELRILAHLSDDGALIEAFRQREDIHARTAALVYGMNPNEVDAGLRTRAKAINYGLMYGMGASRLAAETGMTPPEAKKFIKAYFKALPGVKQLLDHTLEQARETRQVWTLFGRRRPLPDIDSTNAMQRVAAENMAVNTPIQGTAADIIKLAMLNVHGRLRQGDLRARLLLQVHDELVLDVPDDELEVVQDLVREAMEGAADLKVPLEVTMGHGHSWLEAH